MPIFSKSNEVKSLDQSNELKKLSEPTGSFLLKNGNP